MIERRLRRSLGALSMAGAGACAAASAGSVGSAAGGGTMSADVGVTTAQDSTRLVPPGLGTLRQDDVAIRLTLDGGVTVRLIPLDESVIRLLSRDSYQSLHDLAAGRAAQLREIARRAGNARLSVWQATFYGTEQAEARFSPQEVIVTTGGRDFRPLDIVPLTPGFGSQRIRQRGVQSALYAFDGTLDVNQPQLVVTVQGARDGSWGSAVLPRLERERALVRTRTQQRP